MSIHTYIFALTAPSTLSSTQTRECARLIDLIAHVVFCTTQGCMQVSRNSHRDQSIDRNIDHSQYRNPVTRVVWQQVQTYDEIIYQNKKAAGTAPQANKMGDRF